MPVTLGEGVKQVGIEGDRGGGVNGIEAVFLKIGWRSTMAQRLSPDSPLGPVSRLGA